MFVIEKWTVKIMLVSSKAVAIKTTPPHSMHTHTITTTIKHIKAWPDFISATVTVKRQWLQAFGNINTIETHWANRAVNGVWFENNDYTRLITHMQIYAMVFEVVSIWQLSRGMTKTNKMIYAPSEDWDQPEHPPSLIRVCAVRLKQNWIQSYPLRAQRRLWSDCVDAQADLSLCWAQRSFCCCCCVFFFCVFFCHEAAQNAFSSSLNIQHIYISSHFFFFFFFFLHFT